MIRNLADPDFEPSDEDFEELMHRAMSDARAGDEAAARALREEIRIERIRMREMLAQKAGTGG